MMKELYIKLVEAYSDRNLNLITGKLIELYKAGSYRQIREIADKISDYIKIDEEKDARCFSKLIRLYHPDRGEAYRQTILNLYKNENLEKLREFSHILLLNQIDKMQVPVLDEDIGYCPEYMWDTPESGYNYFTVDEEGVEDFTDYMGEYESSFYNAVKMRMYGDINAEFPTYYLEDYEDIEMADSNIEFLDGIEYCRHALYVDLSNNYISDISELVYLKSIEELYLANNQISLIDSLSYLKKLRTIDLSGNQIDDMSPLYSLDNLEYVNLLGNPITDDQIQKLTSKGIIVMG